MDITRRDFLTALATAVVLPMAGGSSPAFTVDRRTMWSPDLNSEETLARCNKILAADPNNVLALIHRGQIPSIYTDQEQAWKDLSRAIYIEPTNPCCHYIRGVCFDNAESLHNAIRLISIHGDIGGRAICSSSPDYYRWRNGTEAGELLYMSHRELGGVLEEQQKYAEAIAAFKKAAQFEIISPEDLETWAEASFMVGSYGRCIVEHDRLIAIEPKAEFIRRREECWAAISVRKGPREAKNCRPSQSQAPLGPHFMERNHYLA